MYKREDLLGEWFAPGRIFFSWFPICLLATTAFFPAQIGPLFVSALSLMATGCAINAFRCGRRHCFFTAPYFFVLAVASALT